MRYCDNILNDFWTWAYIIAQYIVPIQFFNEGTIVERRKVVMKCSKNIFTSCKQINYDLIMYFNVIILKTNFVPSFHVYICTSSSD